MNTTSKGRDAERRVAMVLQQKGHKIIATNWRTRWCEIDIVSQKKDCVFFTEVKFRQNNTWGSGLSYITDSKLKQMKFAAELWLSQNNWKNESQLVAAEVTGDGEIIFVDL